MPAPAAHFSLLPYRRNLQKAEGSLDRAEAEEHTRWLDRSRKAAHTQHGEGARAVDARSHRSLPVHATVRWLGQHLLARRTQQRRPRNGERRVCKTAGDTDACRGRGRAVCSPACRIAAMTGWSLGLEDLFEA